MPATDKIADVKSKFTDVLELVATAKPVAPNDVMKSTVEPVAFLSPLICTLMFVALAVKPVGKPTPIKDVAVAFNP